MREKKIKLAKKQEEATDTVKLEETKRPKKLTGELKDKTEKKSDVGKDAESIEEIIEETSENIIIEVLEKEEKKTIEEALKEHEENEEAE